MGLGILNRFHHRSLHLGFIQAKAEYLLPGGGSRSVGRTMKDLLIVLTALHLAMFSRCPELLDNDQSSDALIQLTTKNCQATRARRAPEDRSGDAVVEAANR